MPEAMTVPSVALRSIERMIERSELWTDFGPIRTALVEEVVVFEGFRRTLIRCGFLTSAMARAKEGEFSDGRFFAVAPAEDVPNWCRDRLTVSIGLDAREQSEYRRINMAFDDQERARSDLEASKKREAIARSSAEEIARDIAALPTSAQDWLARMRSRAQILVFDAFDDPIGIPLLAPKGGYAADELSLARVHAAVAALKRAIDSISVTPFDSEGLRRSIDAIHARHESSPATRAEADAPPASVHASTLEFARASDQGAVDTATPRPLAVAKPCLRLVTMER